MTIVTNSHSLNLRFGTFLSVLILKLDDRRHVKSGLNVPTIVISGVTTPNLKEQTRRQRNFFREAKSHGDYAKFRRKNKHCFDKRIFICHDCDTISEHSKNNPQLSCKIRFLF